MAAALVMKQSAIFIDDGDVHRLMRLLRNPDGSGNLMSFQNLLHLLLCFFFIDTRVLAALREKFTGRGVISGSGAGAAILSGGPLPISGHSYETLA